MKVQGRFLKEPEVACRVAQISPIRLVQSCGISRDNWGRWVVKEVEIF